MSSSETLYWHDYETFGAQPRVDRPAQFAGLRTDLELNPIDEPLVIYARPPRDRLPSPDACLITGITPQLAEARGVVEAEFIRRILEELALPGTCALGYNSLRFDDEVTRHTLYRNLHDPYAREYSEGCSRWDLIDALRTAYALRPEGIEWPMREDGEPSFRLSELTAANGIEHGAAHDALADVNATIAMARLLRRQQPKLFDWLFRQRSKAAVKAFLAKQHEQPMLHVSGRFGAARAHLGLIVPLTWHPANGNELICADLSVDAQLLIALSGEDLRRLLYTRASDLREGEARPGIKSVHINRCPVLLPAAMAEGAVLERAKLDRAACERNHRLIREHESRHPGALRDKLREMTRLDLEAGAPDVDEALYSGGFLPPADRRLLDRLLMLSPEELARATPVFEDRRLDEMLFRYRARNFPETLNSEERERWEAFRYARLTGEEGPGPDLEAYHTDLERRLAEADISERDREILAQLQNWGDELLS
ncbi:MAG: exodeoxyribonuclease I [Halieaceae bacterium]|nr:exodeoxyribonuclease I [Halieaceae bacterium]